VNTHRVTVT